MVSNSDTCIERTTYNLLCERLSEFDSTSFALRTLDISTSSLNLSDCRMILTPVAENLITAMSSKTSVSSISSNCDVS